MTTVTTHPLDAPLDAPLRGADCRARDLDLERNVHGIHHFRATAHCLISNGLIRATVGAEGAVPSLVLEAWRGPVVVGDILSDILSDILPGHLSVPGWQPVGTVVLDAPALAPVLVAVRLEWLHPLGREVILQLVAPAMGDAFVTLARGERALHVQHGDPLEGVVATRSIRLTASPSPAGTASATNLVEEPAPAIEGFPRWVGAAGPGAPDAAAFRLSTSAPAATAVFGAGVGTYSKGDWPMDQHRQLQHDKRPVLVMR